jgi:hypothetical protein
MRCTTDVLIRINPVFYAFEILVANEFHGVNFPCDQYIPAGPGYGLTGTSFICNSVGSVAGQTFVSGDRYLDVAYEYSFSHVCKSPPHPPPPVYLSTCSVLTTAIGRNVSQESLATFGIHTKAAPLVRHSNRLPHLLHGNLLHRGRDQLFHKQHSGATRLPARPRPSVHAEGWKAFIRRGDR